MPYFRTRRSRRRFARRRFRNRARSVRRIAARQAYRAIARTQEVKHHDVFTNSISAITTGAFGCLSQPTQGQTDATRIGDKLRIKNLYGRALIKPWGTNTSRCSWRLIIFQWFPDTLYDVPTMSTVLDGVGTVPVTLEPYIWDGRSKFKVLLDKRGTFAPCLDTSVTPNVPFGQEGARDGIHLKWFIPGKKFRRQIKFNAGGVTAANHIYYLWWGDSDTYKSTLAYTSRLTYTDS